MAGSEIGGDDEETESLMLTLDHIYEDFRDGASEIQLLKSNLTEEINKREDLHLVLKSLRQENARLTKLYAESLNNLVDQVEHRTTCQSLKEQLKSIKDGCLIKQDEHREAIDVIKQEHARNVADIEARVRGLVAEKARDEATVSHLRQDLEAHKLHIQHLASRLNQVHSDIELKHENQELKNRLKSGQEEKMELNKKLQQMEKQLLICRLKHEKPQQNFTSDSQAEMLQRANAVTRKGNKILKRTAY